MKRIFAVALLALSATFQSCKKDADNDNSTASNLYGSWTFTGIKAHVVADISATGTGANLRSVSTTDYTSTTASGTLTVSADKIESKNFAYSATGTVKSSVIADGISFDNTESPFSYIAPKTSSTGAYTAYGSDSIYVQNGFIAIGGQDNIPGSVTPTNPGGCKYSISGNVLTMKISVNNSNTTSAQGITSVSNVKAQCEASFKRQ